MNRPLFPTAAVTRARRRLTAVLVVLPAVAVVAWLGFIGVAWVSAPCEDFADRWYLRYMSTPGRCLAPGGDAPPTEGR